MPLSQLTRPELQSGPARINRYKLERSATVTAFVSDGYLASKVNQDVLDRLATLRFPPGYAYIVGGEAEIAARNSSGLGGLILLAVFGILGVLVAEFGRFREVAVVAGVIPLGLFGGLADRFRHFFRLALAEANATTLVRERAQRHDLRWSHFRPD